MPNTIPNPVAVAQARIAAAKERYESAMHAMQTGVAFLMQSDPSESSPKHLRVGVNSALLNCGALAALLLQKGVFTQVEYYEMLADFAERVGRSAGI